MNKLTHIWVSVLTRRKYTLAVRLKSSQGIMPCLQPDTLLPLFLLLVLFHVNVFQFRSFKECVSGILGSTNLGRHLVHVSALRFES